MCLICDATERCVAIIPCGHHVFCESCSRAEIPSKVRLQLDLCVALAPGVWLLFHK